MLVRALIGSFFMKMVGKTGMMSLCGLSCNLAGWYPSPHCLCYSTKHSSQLILTWGMTCYHWNTCEWNASRGREGWSGVGFPQVEQIKSRRNHLLNHNITISKQNAPWQQELDLNTKCELEEKTSIWILN